MNERTKHIDQTVNVEENRGEHNNKFGSETVTIPVNRSTKFSILYTILDVAYVDNFSLH